MLFLMSAMRIWIAFSTFRKITYVGFSRLALPEDNARSVYRRMIAERSSIANEYRALGRQKASEIRAQADHEKSDILADAYKTSEITRGEGDALAADIYGKTYSKSPEFFKFLRALEADRKILNKKATVITLTGFDKNNPLRSRGDINIWLNSDDYGFVELGHGFILHNLADRIKFGTGLNRLKD